MKNDGSNLYKAYQDLYALRHLDLDDEIAYDIYAFHLQQVFEKMMKHAIYLRAITIPYTHDLVELYELLTPMQQDIFQLDTYDLKKLTSYEASSRYSSQKLIYSRKTLEQYHILAVKIFEQLQKQANEGYTFLFT